MTPADLPAAPYVDRAARDRAIALIAQFRQNLISVAELQFRFPSSTDPALGASLAAIVATPTGKSIFFNDRVRIPDESAALLDRWSLFLPTDLPFVWAPKPSPPIPIGGVRIAGVIVSICVFLAGVAMLGPAVAGKRWPMLVGLSLACAALIGFAFAALANRARDASLNDLSDWIRHTNSSVYPFRSEEELRQACPVLPPLDRPRVCPGCGYDLSAVPQPGCPECGLGRTP